MGWLYRGFIAVAVIVAFAAYLFATDEPEEVQPSKYGIQKVLRKKKKSVEYVESVKPVTVDNPTVKTVAQDDRMILGSAVATQNQCVNFLLSNNPLPKISVTPEKLVAYYYEEAAAEGIRPDIAFAQAIHETNFFRFDGTVQPTQNNYCGLGTTSSEIQGAYFSTAQLGVRAHIQHLLAYSTDRLPKFAIVDPRFDLAAEKTVNSKKIFWTDLNGIWAVPGNGYGQKILHIYQNILNS